MFNRYIMITPTTGCCYITITSTTGYCYITITPNTGYGCGYGYIITPCLNYITIITSSNSRNKFFFYLSISTEAFIGPTTDPSPTPQASIESYIVRRRYQYYHNDLEWLYIHTIEPPYSCYQLLHPTLMLVWYNKRWYCSNMSILAIPPIYCQY